jgi:hypothetical protein
MRATRRLLGGWAIALALSPTSACLLVDPGGDLPTIPRRRPFIVQGDVVPAASTVLGTFPEKLIVPVELADPTSDFEYSAFLDYNPLTGQTLLLRDRATFDRTNVSSGVRTLELSLTPPSDLDRCHTIEVVVALRLSGGFGVGAHTPAEPGGDSITWFYNPNGGLAGCPSLDAGVDAAAFAPPASGAPGAGR